MIKKHIVNNRFFYTYIISFVSVLGGLSYLLYSKYSFLKTELVGVCNALGMTCENMLSNHHRGVTTSVFTVLSLIIFSILGSLIHMVYFVLKTRRFVLSLTGSRQAVIPTKLNHTLNRLGIKNRVLYVNSKSPVAFCYGYFSPKIIISDSFIKNLTNKELEAVLLHEMRHMKNYDPLKILILRGISKGFFYLPLLGNLTNEFVLNRELDIDKEVMNKQKTEANIGSAILKAIKMKTSYSFSPNLMIGGFNQFEERVKGIVDPSYKRKYNLLCVRFFISLIAVVGTISFLNFTNAQAYSIEPEVNNINMSQPANFSYIEEAHTGICPYES